MKRNVFFALIAILAVGLLFMGCPSGEPEDAPNPAPKPPITGPENPATEGEDNENPDVTEETPDSEETPMIDEDASELADATYELGIPADPLVVVPVFTDNSANYEYNWYYTMDPDSESPDPDTFELYKSHGDGDNIDAEGVYIVPPTGEVGTFYYYVAITFGAETIRSPLIKIVVVNP